MSGSSTAGVDRTVEPGTAAVAGPMGVRGDLTAEAEAEVVAEAEAVLVDALFDEIVGALGLDRCGSSVIPVGPRGPVVVAGSSRQHRRVALRRSVRPSVRSPPGSNRR